MFSRADEFIAGAVGRLDDGDPHAASEVAGVGLQCHPDSGRLWEVRGCALCLAGDPDEAVDCLERASLLVPLGALAQVSLADAYVERWLPESALAIYDHLARWDGTPVALLPRVAAGLGRLQQYVAALRTCRRIVGLRPTHHAAHFGVAYYLARLERPAAEAVPPLRRALGLCPGNLIYRLNLAAAYVRMGRLADAYTLAADVSPERLPCRGWAAQLLPAIEWGGDQEMAAAYRRAAGGFDDGGH